MADATPNQPESAETPKPTSGPPPKAPPPPSAGPKIVSPAPSAAAPASAGGPPKAPPPPGAGGPPKAPPPPGAGGPPKAPAPPGAAPAGPKIVSAAPAGAPPRAAPPPAPAPGGVPKPAAPVAAAAAPAKKEVAPVIEAPKGVTRREFLNYVWGASMALFMVQFGGLSFFFALPRPRVGEFGGVIKVDVAQYQESAEKKTPIANNVGKFWIVNTEAGINALYKVCTHLGCIYPWSDAAGIFACPCHGSQFKMDGTYVAGPAPRSLDRFQFKILDAAGNEIGASTDKGEAVPLPANAAIIVVDSGAKITGKSHL